MTYKYLFSNLLVVIKKLKGVGCVLKMRKLLSGLCIGVVSFVTMGTYVAGASTGESSQTLNLSGTPSEIGQQYGELAKSAIQENVTLFKKTANLIGYSDEELIEAGTELETYLLEQDSDLIEQFQAMAEGSGVSYIDLLAFNQLEETVLGDGCTTILADGKATKTGATYYHKTRDASRGYKQVVVQVQPEDGNKFIGITSAGSSGIAMGINEHGVSVGNNVLSTWDTGRGYGNLTIIRMALENVSNTQEAVDYVATIDRSSGSVYGIADETEAAFVETTNSAYGVIWVEDEAIAHTNHFIHPDMLVYEDLSEDLTDERWDWSWYISTEERLERATELLEKDFGKLDIQRIIKISEDQNGEDPTLWIDAQAEINGRAMGSVSTGTFDGSKLRMWSQLGQPSVAPAIPFDVDRPLIPMPFNSGMQSDRIEKTTSNRN
ncbi:C45 family autoproteolytic acyltransferase/hydrolase [Litchfieldia salsa]